MPRTPTADTPVGDLRQSWTRHLRAEGRSAATIRNYGVTLNQFSRWLAERDMPATPAEITADDITDFLLDIAEATSANNAGFHFRNLRALFKWLTSSREQAVRPSDNPMLDVTPPRLTEPLRPAFTDDEVAALIRACRGTRFDDRRDEAIIRVFWATGVRIAGMAGLAYDPDHTDLDNDGRNDVFLDGAQPLLRVRLKGGRVHLAPLGARTASALDRYLRTRPTHHHAHERTLWLGRQGGLGVQGVHYMLKRRATQAGLATRMHAHRFRRTLATRLLDEGVDRAYVAEVLGWRDLRHVALYASDTEQRRAWDAVRKAGIDSRV